MGDLSWHTTLFLSSHGSKEAICIAVVGILIVRLLQSQSEGAGRRGSSHSWINHSDGWVYAPALDYCFYDLLSEDLRVTMNMVLKALHMWMLRVDTARRSTPKINYHCGFLDFKIPSSSRYASLVVVPTTRGHTRSVPVVKLRGHCNMSQSWLNAEHLMKSNSCRNWWHVNAPTDRMNESTQALVRRPGVLCLTLFLSACQSSTTAKGKQGF